MKQLSLIRAAMAALLVLGASPAIADDDAPADDTKAADTPTPAVDAPADDAPAAPAPTPAAKAPAPVAAPAPAAPAAPVAAPAPPPPEPTAAENRFAEARDLYNRRKYDETLKALDKTAAADGFTPALANFARLLRAEALMQKKKPDRARAHDLVLRLVHEDREGTIFSDATDAVKALVAEIRDQSLVFTDTIPATRPGRPIKLKAHVLGPEGTVTAVKVHFKAHDVEGAYTDSVMKPEMSGFAFLLREPQTLAPDGVVDDYSIDYYLTAHDASGKQVDSDGSPAEPLLVTVSTAKASAADKASGVDLKAITLHENTPAPLPPPPPPVTPWYAQWYTITGASVVVAAVVGIIVYENLKPYPPVPGHLATLCFGDTQCQQNWK